MFEQVIITVCNKGFQKLDTLTCWMLKILRWYLLSIVLESPHHMLHLSWVDI